MYIAMYIHVATLGQGKSGTGTGTGTGIFRVKAGQGPGWGPGYGMDTELAPLYIAMLMTATGLSMARELRRSADQEKSMKTGLKILVFIDFSIEIIYVYAIKMTT